MREPIDADLPTMSFFDQQQLRLNAKRIFQLLASVTKNATLYPRAHPSLLSSAEQLCLALEDFLSKRSEAAFTIIAGELFFETISLPIDESMADLVDACAAKNAGSILFKAGLKRNEVVTFAFLMRYDPETLATKGGIGQLLRQENVSHILVQRIVPVEQKQGVAIEKKRASAIFSDAVDIVKESVHSIRRGRAINVRKMQSVVHEMVDNILENRNALLGLTTIKLYDEYTFAHCVNVAVLSIAMGAYLSFEKHKIAALGTAGLLHDIGKVNIPLSIVNKPDVLTDKEWEIMKRHPVEGATILSGMTGLNRLAIVAAFEHHMHYSSRGYPDTGGTSQIHPFSQIVAIADTYDALTSVRVYYRLSKRPDEAIKILLNKRCTVFEPMLVKAFVNMVGIFPIGALLQLTSNEKGLVVQQTRDLVRPRVLLLRTFDGSEREEVSLLETEKGRYKRSIAAVLSPEDVNVDIHRYFV